MQEINLFSLTPRMSEHEMMYDVPFVNSMMLLDIILWHQIISKYLERTIVSLFDVDSFVALRKGHEI